MKISSYRNAKKDDYVIVIESEKVDLSKVKTNFKRSIRSNSKKIYIPFGLKRMNVSIMDFIDRVSENQNFILLYLKDEDNIIKCFCRDLLHIMREESKA